MPGTASCPDVVVAILVPSQAAACDRHISPRYKKYHDANVSPVDELGKSVFRALMALFGAIIPTTYNKLLYLDTF